MTEPEGPGDPQPRGERDDRPDIDIDTAFAAIIENFEVAVPHGVGPWPASEDLDDDQDDDRDDDPDGASGPASDRGADDRRPQGGPTVVLPPGHWDPPARRISIPDERPARIAPGSGRNRDRDDDDEEGFEPPEPPPFPRGDTVSRAAWAAVVGGPTFLLLAALLWRSLPTFLLLIALVAFIGGFVTLVARMPPEHPDDPDDGAVV
jgi:hypothetical protein